MLINFNTVLSNLLNHTQLENAELPAYGSGQHPKLTVAYVVVKALLTSPGTQEAPISIQEKIERYNLAMLIQEGARNQFSVEIDQNQAAVILELVGTAYAPMIVGPIANLLQGVDPDEI